MLVLGIDPGTITLGYGIVSGETGKLTSIGYGSLTFPATIPIEERLHRLYQGLVEILNRYPPDEVAIEEPFLARNVRTALAMGRAQAVAILVAANQGLPIYRYTPAQVKQQVAGYGRSDKRQVQDMVRIQLGLPQNPQPNDAADALAIAICHLGQRHFARLVTRCEE